MLCHIATVWKPQNSPESCSTSGLTLALLDMEDVTSRYLARLNTHSLLLLLMLLLWLLLLLLVVVWVVVLSHSYSRMSDTATTNDPGANILALSVIVYRTCDRQRPNSSGAEY